MFSWRISPYAISTPTQFGPRKRRPQLGAPSHFWDFTSSKAPFHVRFQYSGKTRCVANHANVRWLKQCVFHPTPLLLRHGSDQNFHFSSTERSSGRALPRSASGFARNEVRCETRGCSIVQRKNFPPPTTSTPTRFGHSRSNPILGPQTKKYKVLSLPCIFLRLRRKQVYEGRCAV